MADKIDTAQEIMKIRQDITDIKMYLRITAVTAARSIASTIINTKEKAIVYEKIDGENSQYKIESLTKIPQRTISRWTDDFLRAGFVSPPNQEYKYCKALFTLRELDIALTDLKQRKIRQDRTTKSVGEKLR